MTEQDMIAAFIARKGITRIAEGEASVSSRQMYAAVRGEQDLINERRVMIDHCGREHVRNGLGEWIS